MSINKLMVSISLPVDVENMDSEKFHEVYGDTFISGLSLVPHYVLPH